MEKKEQKLVSIIIPIYKVEQYLIECIQSVRKQTYKNIEIILVDDGSPDNCGKICDDYAKKDKRISVIHKENGGLSDARNKGIDSAKGEYITFVDSDDYIEETFIEELYNAITKDNSDLSICNINIVDENGEKTSKLGFESSKIVGGKQILKGICEQKNMVESIVAWNKMYSISFFNTYRYPTGKIHEDEFLTYKILYQAKRVSIINKYLYNYRKNNQSIVGKKFNQQRLDLLEALSERLEFYKNNKEEYLYSMTLMTYLNQLIEYYIKTKKYIKNSKTILKGLKKKFILIYKEYIKIKDISVKAKVKAIVFRYSPNLIYNIKKDKY